MKPSTGDRSFTYRSAAEWHYRRHARGMPKERSVPLAKSRCSRNRQRDHPIISSIIRGDSSLVEAGILRAALWATRGKFLHLTRGCSCQRTSVAHCHGAGVIPYASDSVYERIPTDRAGSIRPDRDSSRRTVDDVVFRETGGSARHNGIQCGKSIIATT